MMTTIAADSHSRGSLHHCDVDYTHSAVVSPSSARPDIISMKPEPGHERKMTAQEPDLFDQNTLLPYVYCFIKNFVGWVLFYFKVLAYWVLTVVKADVKISTA